MEYLLLLILFGVFLQTSYLVFYKDKRKTGSKVIVLDTSVLIDGRIESIVRSGLVTSELIVTKSVIRELQFMADKADHEKRERARFGLEIIEKLQSIEMVSVRVVDDGVIDQHGVDEQLMNFAARNGYRLCTIDYNLNKAARVQAVEVININELAHSLRVLHLPGEVIDVQLIQPGQDKRQAVGYLDDGTMVVVDDAREDINTTVSVELVRVLQTSAGRMMFAKKHRTSNQRKQSTSPQQKQTMQNANRQKRSSIRRNSTKKTSSSSRQSGRKVTNEDKLVDLANK